MNSTLSDRMCLPLIVVCLLLYTPTGVNAFQQEGPARSRIGVREYLLAGVFDNLTIPAPPGSAAPGLIPLRNRGLYAPESIPGFRQDVEVQPGHTSIRFQTLVRSLEVRKPTVMSFAEYLERVRQAQTRRILLAGFAAGRQVEEERRGLLEFEIPINVPRGLER
ncbi:hypothetical protein ACFL6R_06560, partial [Gemmatimonadota bacterium]